LGDQEPEKFGGFMFSPMGEFGIFWHVLKWYNIMAPSIKKEGTMALWPLFRRS